MTILRESIHWSESGDLPLETKNEDMLMKLERELFQDVVDIIEGGEGKLGEGGAAGVYELKSNNRLCYKIEHRQPVIHNKSSNQQNIPPYYREWHNNKAYKQEVAWHVSPEQEMGMANDAYSYNDGSVIIPRHFMTMKLINEIDDNNVYVYDEINIILMQRLQAVSVADFVTQRNRLFHDLDPEKFRAALLAGVENLNEKGFFHRDLHEGNIMIDISTHKPCIIDFGRSIARAEERDAYSEEKIGGHIQRFPHDMQNANKVADIVESCLENVDFIN